MNSELGQDKHTSALAEKFSISDEKIISSSLDRILAFIAERKKLKQEN